MRHVAAFTPNWALLRYYHDHRADAQQACDQSNGHEAPLRKMRDADPRCAHTKIVCAKSGGMECAHCHGWFCPLEEIGYGP